jgi:hypothetical protein
MEKPMGLRALAVSRPTGIKRLTARWEFVQKRTVTNTTTPRSTRIPPIDIKVDLLQSSLPLFANFTPEESHLGYLDLFPPCYAGLASTTPLQDPYLPI